MRPTDPDAIATAWRALSGSEGRTGWRTSEVLAAVNCRLLAARLMPGDREALLAGFRNDAILSGNRPLPEGRGFDLEHVADGPAGHAWLALSRREGASLELFDMMVHDLVGTMRDSAFPTAETFLRRIRLWQDFMSRGTGALLGPDAEVGLFGELHLLELLAGHLDDAEALIGAWTGPTGSLHDFAFGTGAIEVKTSLSANGFRARIGSLEQLDPSVRSPLCLAAVRLSVAAQGLTLAEMVSRVVDRLGAPPMLGTRLCQAGYLPEMAEHHVRRFLVTEVRLIEVGEGFPYLATWSVPAGVVDARYTIDLQTGSFRQPDIRTFLQQAGQAAGP